MDIWLWGFLLLLALYGVSRLGWDFSIWYRRTRSGRRAAGTISLLILAKEAEESIEGLIRVGYGLLRQAPGQGEVVVIDENSSDGTWAILQKLQRDYPLLKVARWQSRGGQGSADGQRTPLELGYVLADYPVVLVVRAGKGDTRKTPTAGLWQGLRLARRLEKGSPEKEINDI